MHFIDEQDPHVNPLGVKGVGEIGIVGIAAAIANAIYHATAGCFAATAPRQSGGFRNSVATCSKNNDVDNASWGNTAN